MKGLISKFPKHGEIVEAQLALEAAEKSLEKVIKVIQSRCKHLEVFECDFEGSDYGNHLAPRRLCCNCGFEEDGWGCGYGKLASAEVVVPVTRDELYRQRN